MNGFQDGQDGLEWVEERLRATRGELSPAALDDVKRRTMSQRGSKRMIPRARLVTSLLAVGLIGTGGGAVMAASGVFKGDSAPKQSAAKQQYEGNGNGNGPPATCPDGSPKPPPGNCGQGNGGNGQGNNGNGQGNGGGKVKPSGQRNIKLKVRPRRRSRDKQGRICFVEPFRVSVGGADRRMARRVKYRVGNRLLMNRTLMDNPSGLGRTFRAKHRGPSHVHNIKMSVRLADGTLVRKHRRVRSCGRRRR